MYSGKSTPGQPDADLVRAEAEQLWKAVKKGWNTNGENIKYGSAEQRMLINMRYNTFVASVFKRHHFALDMARELFDQKGELRSFADFRKAVKDKIDPKYNKAWLRTEYNTAYASGQMARKWQTYVRKGGFIVYVAVMDARTRYDHARMNKARYPVDHPFWLTHYPPNGYNCRCTTRWDGTEGTLIEAEAIDDVPPFFQNNVGMTGLVFKDSPYFTVDGAFKEVASTLFGFRPPVDPVKYEANLQIFNRLMEDKNYKLAHVDILSGGYVFRNVKASKLDLAENIAVSKVLAAKGEGVIIRDTINSPGVKNPDININGVAAEIKTNQKPTRSAIDNELRDAKNQASTVVLNIQSSIAIEDLERAIYERVKRTGDIKTVIVVFENEAYELTAEEIRQQTFYGKIGRK